jgi:hypothetical protein
MLSVACKERTVVVFEPEGIAHQTVESPKVNRSVFASLARVRNDHPVVASEGLGWGIECPEPTQGGTFSTLLHSEMTPGLLHLHDACVRAGSSLSAWSAYTAATACVRARSALATARFVLILVPGFAAVATCARGRRAFRRWTGPMEDKDWRALLALIGDSEGRPAPSMKEAKPRHVRICVIAEGEPGYLCPVWEEIRGTGRLEEVVGLEAFAAGAARLAANHPGNLVEGFPRPRRLDRYLVGAVASCLTVAAAIAADIPNGLARLKAADASSASRVSALEGRLEALRRNQGEMEKLRGEALQGPGPLQVGRHQALVDLAAALPEGLTLTSLSIDKNDGFAIKAIVVGADFDPEGTRRALDRIGFRAEGPKGWEFNAFLGTLSVCGRYAAPLL